MARVNTKQAKALFFTYRPYLYSSLALLLYFTIVLISYFGFEYYIKTRRVPLVALRSIVISTINEKIDKAVDLGVVDFSLREGLILEDLVISQEEDFSFNAHLLKVKRVTFRLSSVLAKVPHVDRVDFYSPQLTLNNDQSIETKLLEYFKSTKVSEVHFHDLRVSLNKDDLSVLDWKEGWDVHFFRKNGKILVEYENGIYWLPNATRIKGEGYLSETEIGDFKFNLTWKNYPSEESPLLVSYLFGTTMQSAVISGEGVWENSSAGEIIKGNVEFESSSFIVSQIPGFVMNDLRFQEKFLFHNGKEMREFSSLDFQLKIEDEITTAKESLLHRKIDFNIDDLSEISKGYIDLVSGQSVPLKGKLRGSLDVRETGEKNKWFKTKAAISGEELEWNSDLFAFQNGTLEFNIEEGNQLKFNLKGELFDKPVNLEALSGLDWSRSKKTDGTFYYPLSSKTKATLEIKSLLSKHWSPIYDTWKKDTIEEIKERQEKLIPEEYFYQKKVYKYFLESMNFDLAIHASDFFPYEGSASSGELKGSLVVKDGRMNTTFTLPTSGSKISMSSYFATKTPNFSFSLFLVNYPWNRPWTEVCGINLLPESVNLDYAFVSQGSDYYTLSKDARINYLLRLENVKAVGKELWVKLGLPEKSISDPLRIEFNLDHYFDSDYIRNLSISSASVDWKGYAQNKSGYFTYNLYGSAGDSRGNWSFTEEENRRCTVK